MQVFFILGIPLFLAVSVFLFRKHKGIGLFNACGHFVILCVVMQFVYNLVAAGKPLLIYNFFYVDALGAFFILVISLINFASSLYSVEYIKEDLKEGHISERKSGVYYLLFNLFTFTMFFVTVVDSLGLVWVAIEMTTLVSAFLVGFYNNKKSIEAAWKYIIICSVGITFALMGTILFYYTASTHAGINTINWTDMVSTAQKLDPRVVKIAFLFILAGFGTKAGLVPMHTWLPDAHSQAPAPISALLSGVLLKTAIYAILRYAIIVNKCIGPQFTSNLFIFFGLLSLGVSAGFIIAQKDIKRLLAYSSVEHVGIITLGLGFGGPVGLYAALLHIFNHAVTKSLMFFGAGNIVKTYKTNNMNIIRGVIKVMPFVGALVVLGVFALGGSPPFSIFISEIMILIAGFQNRFYIQSFIFLVFAVIIFGALIFRFSRVLLGKKPEGIDSCKQPLSTKISFIFLFGFMFVLGFVIPGFLNNILTLCVEIIKAS